MILFLRRIPANTHPDEMQDFVEQALKGGIFSKSGSVIKAEIIAVRDKYTKSVEFHGLVHLDSDKSGQRALKKLKGKPFKNKHILVKEYKHRTWHNDSRINYKNTPQDILNKRVGDRRRESNPQSIKELAGNSIF
jgi:hypothetical protein